MSLIFEAAVGAFDVSEATMVAPEAAAVRPREGRESLPTDGIVDHASRHAELAHPDDDYVCVPLHERDSAALTGEYVCYADHSLHGEIFVFERDGDREKLSAEAFGRTPLADRIRFWHSDYVPDEDPDYYDSPLSDAEAPRNPVGDPERFFDRLAEFVERERRATRERNRERLNLDGRSPRSLYESGEDAIPDLSNLGDPEDRRYRFRVPDRLVRRATGDRRRDDGRTDGGQASLDVPHRFVQGEFGIHEGNEALLVPPDAESAPDEFPLRVTVESIRGPTLSVSVDWNTVEATQRVGSYLRKRQDGFGLVGLLNDVPFEREREAVEALREDPRYRALLTGRTEITFTDTGAVESTQQDDALNQEQQLAVEGALLADPLFCIHGPPGTGKTRTLVEVVRRAARAGQSVLVCADSNQAIDNLAVGDSTPDRADERSLHAYGQHGGGEFVVDRANARRSSNDLVRDCYAGSPDGLADVVVATNSTAATLERTFDLAVIDEATQATCTASAIPCSKARKVVLAGDHQQLPPFSASEEPPESALGMSLFEHLYADGGVYEGVGIQLRTQYRMHRDVAYFPNRRFYDRRLKHGRDVDPVDGEGLAVVGDRESVLGYEIGGTERRRGHSTANPQEAELVAFVVGRLLDAGTFDPEDVGVISPYTAQVREISALLDEHVPGSDAVTVDTVDAFQGSERDAIVVSLVRSNPDGEIGFLGRDPDGPRRLNVALTRARRFCGVVGNWATLARAAETDLYADLRSHLDDTGRLKHVDPMMVDLDSV